ncbi:MAG: glycosyltransferase family 25 protein, partial [Candidatus Hydrogenedentales bacterium]
EKRREEAIQHFRERGLYVEWMFGINAEATGLITTKPYRSDDPSLGFLLPPRKVGCFLSHYMAWTICNHLDDDPIMIVEDDADFPEDWIERVQLALEHVPEDADMLYIGNCNCADKPKDQISGEIFEVRYPFCTHAYVVWKKALPVLLASQRGELSAPIDLSLYYKSYPKLRVYTVLPRIVAQRGTPLSP